MMLDKETYPDARVVGLAQKLIAVKINTDKSPAAAKKYGIEALPTLLFLDAKGKKIHQFEGFRPPADFVKEMQTALSKAKK